MCAPRQIEIDDVLVCPISAGKASSVGGGKTAPPAGLLVDKNVTDNVSAEFKFTTRAAVAVADDALVLWYYCWKRLYNFNEVEICASGRFGNCHRQAPQRQAQNASSSAIVGTWYCL